MIYDEFAREVTATYRLFLMAISGNYQSIVSPGVAVTPVVVKEFALSSSKFANTTIQIVETLATNYLDKLYVEFGTIPYEAMLAKSKFIEGFKKATRENVTQLAKALRTGVNDYKRVLKDAHGSMGLLLQKKMGTVEFAVYDTSNRKWEATGLIGVIARNFAFQLYIDREMEKIRKAGYRLAKVVYDDPNKAHREFVFSSGKQVGRYPTLEDIRAKTFHANSSAKVIPYVSGK